MNKIFEWLGKGIAYVLLSAAVLALFVYTLIGLAMLVMGVLRVLGMVIAVAVLVGLLGMVLYSVLDAIVLKRSRVQKGGVK